MKVQMVNLKKQRGIATILIVLLVGVALTATTLGVVNTVKSTQERQATNHALANAQSAAWMLVEATKNLLASAEDLSVIEGWIDNEFKPEFENEFSHLAGSSIRFTNIEPIVATANQRITAIITARDQTSQSSNVIEVVYDLVPGSVITTPQECASAGSGFVGDVDIEGQTLNFHDGQEFLVDGDYGNPGNGSAISGVSAIRVTGSVYLKGTGNQKPLDLIKANGDVVFDGSVDAVRVEAGGNVIAEGTTNAAAENIFAVGDVSWGSSGETKKIEAGQTITIDNGKHGELLANSIIINRASGAATGVPALNMASHGDIVIAPNNNESFGNLIAKGDISCEGGAWSALSIRAESELLGDCNARSGTALIDQEVEVPIQENITTVTIPRSTFADADNYNANYSYFFKGGEVQVEVSQVTGIDDGTYILEHPTANNSNSYLRLIDDALNIATAPIVCNSKGAVPCILFDTDDNSWYLTGDANAIAPGVYYFDNDLTITVESQASIAASLLAAGNIYVGDQAEAVGGDPYIFAPNYVPEEVLCQNKGLTRSGNGNTFRPGFNPSRPLLELNTGQPFPAPTNFCDGDARITTTILDEFDNEIEVVVNNFIGDVGIMAGEKPPVTEANANPDYIGGDIVIRTSLNVYGKIIAGNAIGLIEGTNIKVWGTISSEAQREGKDANLNTVAGSIDVYKDPNKDRPEDGLGCGTNETTTGSTTLIWSRYL